MLVAVRIALFLVALVAPGGLFVLAGVLVKRLASKTPERLDFEGAFRRVPQTRRGRHSPIVVPQA